LLQAGEEMLQGRPNGNGHVITPSNEREHMVSQSAGP
jgi:hypothetical protein